MQGTSSDTSFHHANLGLHASPLIALKKRDWKALRDLFHREDIDEIEAEINKTLLFLIPEPCWEDDPFDFLREYL
uniref:Uncharacterized protein n=1 Tax=Tolypothrix bouteillei VB521301 TaxID=1479485 RepID=A0A0C1NG61_9CYAN